MRKTKERPWEDLPTIKRQRNQILFLRNRGVSVSQICEMVGVQRTTVYRVVAREKEKQDNGE